MTCYDDAYKRLKSVHNEISLSVDLDELANILGAQVEILAKLKDNASLENEYNLVDLYMNARRRLIKADYTDTLSRFWRVYEGVLFAHLRKFYQVEPKDLSRSSNKSLVKTINDTGIFHSGIRQLSIATSETVLSSIFKDKTFRRIEAGYINVKRNNSSQKMKMADLLKELRERRNESIVAHGMKPVTEDDAVNCLEAIENVMKEFIPATADLIDNYPLNLTQVKKIIDVLDKSFAL